MSSAFSPQLSRIPLTLFAPKSPEVIKITLWIATPTSAAHVPLTPFYHYLFQRVSGSFLTVF